jgi:hypothetical protein
MRGSLEDGDGQSAAAEDPDAAVAGLYRLPWPSSLPPVTGWSGNCGPLATARPPVAWLWRVITGRPKGLSA